MAPVHIAVFLSQKPSTKNVKSTCNLILKFSLVEWLRALDRFAASHDNLTPPSQICPANGVFTLAEVAARSPEGPSIMYGRYSTAMLISRETRVFDRYVHQNTCFGYICDQVK